MRRALAAVALAAVACGGGPAARPKPPAVTTTREVHVTSGPTKPQPIVVLARAKVGDASAGDRAAAIASLADFVARHPDHPQHTPDALLRLGSLQLDEADDALEAGDEARYQRATGEAVRVLAELAARFPAYARLDDAHYLLGFARQQAGDVAGAIAAFEAVAAIAASPRALEARFRAAELYVADGQLERASAAYRAVADGGDPRLATLARYELAWSDYRRGDCTAAQAELLALVDLADSGTDPIAGDLRSEAAQYVAICLVEPDADGDGIDDPPPPGARFASVARIRALLGDGALASRRELAELAAAALADEARHDEALAALGLVLAVTSDPDARARLEAKRADAAARAH